MKNANISHECLKCGKGFKGWINQFLCWECSFKEAEKIVKERRIKL